MIKVQHIESVEDILVSHEGEYFAITWGHSNGFGLERLKPVAPGTPKSKDAKAESKQADKPRESKVGKEENTNQGELPVKRPVKATDTAVVERTSTLCIRQGPLDDILKLENVNKDTVRPILRMWYPHVTESALRDYCYRYLRYLRKTSYIDDDGRVLKELAEEQTEDEGEEEDEEKKPAIPAPETLTVVTTRDDTVIYLEPLNEILELNVVNDAALEQVLSRYYEAPRPAIMYVIKRAWKRFLRDRQFLDKTGKPTSEKVTLQSSEGGDKS